MKDLVSFKGLKALIVYVLFFLLPVQFGYFIFTSQSSISGIRIDYLAPAIYASDIVVILLTLLTISKPTIQALWIWLKKHTSRVALFMIICMVVFVCVNIVSAENMLLAVYKYCKVLELVLVYLLVKNTAVRHKTTLVVFIVSSLIQLLLVVLQFLNQGSLQGVWYFFGERAFSSSTPGIAKTSLLGTELLRGYGTFSHPNSLAGFYLLLYGFTLYFKPFHRRIALRGILLGISLLLILFSFSKLALAGLVVLVVFYSFTEIKKCFICQISSFIIPLVLVGIFLFASGDPESWNKRVFLNVSALSILYDHFFFGVGAGNYVYAQRLFPAPYPYFFLQPVHNVLLLALCEYGALIVVGVLYFLYPFLKRLLSSPAGSCTVFILVFTGMFDHYWLTLQQNLLLIPVVFGLLQSKKNMLQ